MFTDTSEHDVVVVGARCAGAATAMLFAHQGLDVLVVDRADLPSDTLSTHSLSRGALVQLDRWSLLDEVVASGAPEVRTVAFHPVGDGPDVRPVRSRAGIDFLLAPRRHILDAILLDGARQAGAAVQTGINVTGVTQAADGRVDGITLRDADGAARSVSARLVVGADGVRSRIARAAGAAVIDERAPSGATHYLYVSGLPSEGYEFHLGRAGLAGVFRTHGGEAVVWICAPGERDLRDRPDKADGFLDLLAEIAPALATRVRRAALTAPVRSRPAGRGSRRPCRGDPGGPARPERRSTRPPHRRGCGTPPPSRCGRDGTRTPRRASR